MGFKTNLSEASQTENGGIKPEGDYECIIAKAEFHTTPRGAKGINFSFVVRNDIPNQKYKNSYIFHTIWKKKEPNELDMQIEGYNFNQLMYLGKVAGLQDGKEYDNLQGYLDDLKGKCILATLEHDEYNGTKREKVSSIGQTKFPNCSHKFKKKISGNSYAENSTTKFADSETIGSLEDFEDVVSDDNIPF